MRIEKYRNKRNKRNRIDNSNMRNIEIGESEE